MIDQSLQNYSFHFQSGWFPPTYVALLAACLLLAHRTVSSQRPLLSPARYGTLLLLRGFVFFLAVMFVARPVLETKIKLHRKDYVAFLVDESGSMGVQDAPGGISRLVQARELTQKTSLLEKLKKKHDIRVFRFATTTREGWTSGQPGEMVSGGLTDIGQAIHKTETTLSDRPVSGMVLLSDGANNYGEDPLVIAKLRNVPIYPVELGANTVMEDIGVQELELPDTVYLGGEMEIKARLNTRIHENRRITVRLLEGNKEILRKQIDLEPAEEKLLEFTVKPESSGLKRYTLTCDPFLDEAVDINNTRSGFIQVLAEKIKLLIISNHLSWDFSFLKRALAEDPNIDVRGLVKFPETEATPRLLSLKGEVQEKLIRWPEAGLIFKNIDIVVLHGIPAAELPPDYTEQIISIVGKEGVSLILLGGPSSFSSGGYQHSKLSDLIPVVLFEAPDYRPESFIPKPTTAGLFHPVTTLVESATMNRLIWSDFPALLGFNLSHAVKKGATVLLDRPSTEGDSGRIPAAVLGRWERGQVMALCFEGFWRWDLPLKGFSGKTDWHRRFWTQAIRYLASKEDLGTITIKTDKKHYLTGEKAHVEILVSGKDELAASPNVPTGKLLHVWPGVTREVQSFTPSPVQDLPGHFRTSLPLPDLGEYVIEVGSTS
ncbi:MAG: vWA domain-containing protein, partial [bacterium]|nr:vWA domain-containing protein [bacterium]